MKDNPTRTDSRLATLGSVLANWRDWNLPVKLAAVTLVPVIFAIVLGAMQIADQVDRAGSYRQVDRLVLANEELRTLVKALQRERTASAMLLAERFSDTETELRDERDAVDSARVDFTRAAGRARFGERVTDARYRDVRAWLGELRGVREQVSGSLIDASTVLTRYTSVIEALLRFDRALSAEMIDPKLVSASTAQHELEITGEQVQFQHALVGIGIVRGGLVGPDLESLRASLARFEDSIASFRAVADTEYTRIFDRAITSPVSAGRTNLAGAVAASQPGAKIPTTVLDWYASSDAAQSGIVEIADLFGRQVRERSATLQDEASDGAGLAAVILLVALVVAIAVMIVVGRHLVSSLGLLRRSALEVAEQRLPAAVAKIRENGENGEDNDLITLQPVPVTSMDEVGQVARAFDAVQSQALRLATEQAGLRARYSSVFVNLSRRSQGLVQRQLHLLERLERDEEDADQLATLFQLDHLATRMRRNNENLMVLSGSDLGRRNQRPTTLADLLRAAVSEIEQYQRVVMLPPPAVLIVGYAVGDLVRLTAELLDNATSFSAPDTNVTIASHSFDDGSVCVAVLDEGIGMNQQELDEANAKLADSAQIDVSTSRRMGLFVIGRLAGRHGIEVRLNGGPDSAGVRATVTVPSDLIAPTTESSRSTQEPVATVGLPSGALVPFSPSVNGRGGAVNGTHGPTNGVGALPRRRVRPMNGSGDNGGDQTPTIDLTAFTEGPRPSDWVEPDAGLTGPDEDGRGHTNGRANGQPETGTRAAADDGRRTLSGWNGGGAEAATGQAGGNDGRPWVSGRNGGADAVSGRSGAGDDRRRVPGRNGGADAVSGRSGVDEDRPWVSGRNGGADAVSGRNGGGDDRRRVSGRNGGADAVSGRNGAGDDRRRVSGGSGGADAVSGRNGGGDDRRRVSGRNGGADAVSGRNGVDEDRPWVSGRNGGADAVSGRNGGGDDRRQVSGQNGGADTVSGRNGIEDDRRWVSDRNGGGETPVSGRNGGGADAGRAPDDIRRPVSGRNGSDAAAGRGSSTGRRPVSGRSGNAAEAGRNPGSANRKTATEHSAKPGPARRTPPAGPDGERTPLPRRSPGRGRTRPDGTRPHTPFTPAGGVVSPADGLFFSPGRPGAGESPPPAGAPHAPRPHPRRAPAGGVPPLRPNGLFTPWWPPAPPPEPRPRPLDETTPIFDEMVSAWFRAETPATEPATPPVEPKPQPQQPKPNPNPAQQPKPWRFEADAGFDAARAASHVEPAEFTDTGLPRRNPRQNLVPGSVGNQQNPAASPRPGKVAEDMRERLSNYSYGVRRARDHHKDGPTEWHFAADGGWRAANAVSTSKPAEFTTGGLPRRTPLDRLVPGSVPPTATDGAPRADRAEELRGRLGSFQQGLSRGRRSLADRPTANGIRDNEQQERE